MKSSHTSLTERFLALLLFVSIVSGDSFEVLGQENEPSEVFSSPVLDLGIVVKDLDKSASFYKDVIGCKEVKGFSAPPAFATSIGLVNEMEVVARVFVLGAGEKQSRLMRRLCFSPAPSTNTLATTSISFTKPMDVAKAGGAENPFTSLQPITSL